MQIWRSDDADGWGKKGLPERFSTEEPGEPLWQMVYDIMLRHKGEKPYWIVFTKAEECDIACSAKPYYDERGQRFRCIAFLRSVVVREVQMRHRIRGTALQVVSLNETAKGEAPHVRLALLVDWP